MACCMDDKNRKDPVKEPAQFIPFDEIADEKLRSNNKKESVSLILDKPMNLSDDRDVSTNGGGTYRKDEDYKDLNSNRKQVAEQ